MIPLRSLFRSLSRLGAPPPIQPFYLLWEGRSVAFFSSSSLRKQSTTGRSARPSFHTKSHQNHIYFSSLPGSGRGSRPEGVRKSRGKYFRWVGRWATGHTFDTPPCFLLSLVSFRYHARRVPDADSHAFFSFVFGPQCTFVRFERGGHRSASLSLSLHRS